MFLNLLEISINCSLKEVKSLMINLNKAAQGDKDAFDDIIVLYNEKVIKIASIYVGKNFADVVQDVWIKIFEKSICFLMSKILTTGFSLWFVIHALIS